jgi:TonB-linked SusC/RagA family outer membrane protein
MRITICLLFVMALNIHANVFSQATKLTLNLRNATVKEVFTEIERSSGYRFLYRNEFVNENQVVSISANDESLDQIMSKLFHSGDIAYKVFEGNIVVITNKAMQQTKVSGTLADAVTGELLPGVNVIIKGTTRGTTTDIDGKYAIEVNPGDTLQFSYVGYLSEEIAITSQSVVDIKLAPDVQKIEEIVVVGYGTQKKGTLTGSISNVAGKEVAKSPSANLSSSLVGKLPGLTVNQRNGEPGRDDPNILIRGKGTTGDASPLIIVDGVERSLMSRLNPDEIESVSVLKDASAAIYGARAANGVILITTKKGAKGKPVFNFTYNYAFSSPTKIPDMLDAATYAQVYNEASPGTYSDAAIQAFRDGSDPVLYPNTNWAKEELKDYSIQKRLSLQVSGGSESVRYLLSFGNTTQDGLYKHATSDYKQYNVRAKIDVDLTKNLTIGANVSTILGYKDYPTEATWINFTNLLVANPTLVARYPNGLIAPGRLGENPLLIDQRGYDKIEDVPVYSTFTASYKIPYVEGLKIDGSFNYDISNQFEKLYKKPYYYHEYNVLTKQYDYKQGTGASTVELTDTYNKWTTMLFNYKITYEKTMASHHVAAMLGQEQQKNRNTWARAYRKNFVSPAIDQINVGSSASADKDNGGSMTENSYNNYFGRFNYDFASKYLIEFLFRYDGSPKFPEGKRYGFFPGISVGWRMSEEAFMHNNLPFVNTLKLRASYGEVGNDRVGTYQYLQTYAFASNYVFGKSDAPGISANTMPNPDITWEVAKKTDLGIEASLWDGLFGFDFTYWMENRSNILWNENLMIPATFGFPGLPDKNIGKVDNHGFELELKHRNKIGEITYNVNGSIAFSRNEIKYIAETQKEGYEKQWQTGMPIGTNLYYKSDGIFQSKEELDAYPHAAGSKVGDIRIVDLNDDKVIDEKDRYRSKFSSTPEYVFGLNISLEYKNFDFSMFLQGQTNVNNYDGQFAKLGTADFDNAVAERANGHWTVNNNSENKATMPRVRQYTPGDADFFLYDATFARLKTIELGYTLPKNLAAKVKLDDVRIFVSGFNVLTWAKDIKWTDPELSGNILYYPPQRIFNMGINVKF